jgi:hypothetical protein
MENTEKKGKKDLSSLLISVFLYYFGCKVNAYGSSAPGVSARNQRARGFRNQGKRKVLSTIKSPPPG